MPASMAQAPHAGAGPPVSDASVALKTSEWGLADTSRHVKECGAMLLKRRCCRMRVHDVAGDTHVAFLTFVTS
jgi:hypothetical protein